jgi:two-component system, NtrC family, response regulator HupR/HoxA
MPTQALVLAVDDERDNLALIERTLRMRPELERMLTGDAAAALALVKSSPPRFIIVDQRMPGMTGIEFMRAVRELGCRAPAVMLTAYPEDGDVIDAQTTGLVGTVLAKPWAPEDLLPLLDAAVARRG